MSHAWLRPAAIYLAVLGVLLVVSWQTIAHTTPLVDNVWPFWGDSVLGGLAHYDGGWYLLISADGYASHQAGIASPVAFFPGYPLAIRLVGVVVRDDAIAGMLITAACGAGVSVAFWSWCRQRMPALAATTSLLLLLVYPYSYVLYGVIYSEALCLLAAVLAFRFLEDDRRLLAGLAGAVAAFSRPTGVAVAIGLAVAVFQRRGGFRQLQRKDGLVLISFGGTLAYMGYLWARFGNPLLFASVERYWGDEPGPRTWFKVELFQQARNNYNVLFTWGLVAQAALAIAALVLVPVIGRRLGWGYAAYVLVAVGMPVVASADFGSLGRYLILAFPLFALGGQALAEVSQLARRAVLAGSGAGLAAMMAAFAHGYFVA